MSFMRWPPEKDFHDNNDPIDDKDNRIKVEPFCVVRNFQFI